MTGTTPQRRHGVPFVLAIALVIAAAAVASAQPRGGRRGGGPATRVVVAPPIYYYGYGFSDPFWGASWSPYDGWYGQPGPYYRGGPYDPDSSAARLRVKPKQAEVYVDGYLAGSVDDFDGALQRLNVPPGEHTLAFYLEGYQTLTQRVLFRPHATINIKGELQKLAAGQVSGARPEPEARPDGPDTRPMPPGHPAPPARAPRARNGEFGTLAVRVQPRDATVIVDGQEWNTDGAGPLTIELGEGPHDVEVRQDGFTPFRRTVRIRAGNTTTLNVSLSR